jgi:hypothetical protein
VFPDGEEHAVRKISRLRREISMACYSAQQQDQDDERNWNSNQPEQNGHVIFLSGERTI